MDLDTSTNCYSSLTTLVFIADGFKKQIKIFICDIVDTHKEFEDAIAIITMEETMER